MAALRALLARDEMLIVPGAYDAITARAVERAGFDAVYMTGAGTAAALGYPDYGLATMTEMVDNAGRIAAAVSIPVIADADTGYGNELNVARTVREYERRGVAAIHLEDQVFPKRCGHLDEKRVIAAEDFVSKIRAAAASRTDPDFLLIARTDARAVIGLDEAIARANAALAAGADVAFVEAPETLDEIRAVPSRVRGPCLLNYVLGGKTPALDLDEAERAGYRLAIVPGLLLITSLIACEDALAELRATRRHPKPARAMSLKDAFRRFGAEEWDALRRRFGAS
ncbi:MAG TPA: isocitrate lyase/PEP mutase family protein [Candidatus Binatia bacterium]|nr:isocitrate lyase/PEP mutase family protein [Candidatus Binatia bacterium]